MGARERQKGKEGEREVARIYVASGHEVFEDVRRAGNAAGLADLRGLERFLVHPEVKMQGRTDLPGWMRQAEAQAPEGFMPVVHWRLCSRTVSTGWYANLPLLGYIDLLKAAHS